MIALYNFRFVISMFFMLISMQASAIGVFASLFDYPNAVYNVGIQNQINDHYFSFGYGITLWTLTSKASVFNSSYNYSLIKFDNIHMGPGVAFGYTTPFVDKGKIIDLGCTWDLAWMLSNGFSIRSGLGYKISEKVHADMYDKNEKDKRYVSTGMLLRLFRVDYDFKSLN